jgi:hypothetical protein
MDVPSSEVLAEHSVAGFENVYVITRQANFRAQMRNAVRLVRAAFKEKRLRDGTPLLVIGGGVSGAAVALEAAKRGMVVTLLESAKSLLSVQRACSTRRLHPHEYDWPQAHCQTGHYPHLREDKKYCPALMRWEADVASRIAKKISDRIQNECPRNLTIQLRADHVPVSLDTLRKDFDPNRVHKNIIICAGATEDTKVDKFRGFAYWENDPLERLSSLSKRRRSRSVLIAGGGDGGLQDLLRIIYPQINGKKFSAGRLLSQLIKTLRGSASFVDWVNRMNTSSTPFRPEPQLMWQEVRELITSLRTDGELWEAISRKVRSIADREILQGRRTVNLAFKEFTKAFTLNAFLVQLTAEVLSELNCLRPNLELKGVMSGSAAHECAENAQRCCGFPHLVTFRSGNLTLGCQNPFDIVVLRLGSTQVVPRSAVR